MKYLFAFGLFLAAFTSCGQQLSSVAGSINSVTSYSYGYSFELGNYFKIAKNAYIGPGIAVYKLNEIKGSYVPINLGIVYSGSTKVAPLLIGQPGYGFYTGGDKTTWSPFVSVAAGVQLNYPKNSAYLLLTYSRITLNYESESFGGNTNTIKAPYDLIGVRLGIFIKTRKKNK